MKQQRTAILKENKTQFRNIIEVDLEIVVNNIQCCKQSRGLGNVCPVKRMGHTHNPSMGISMNFLRIQRGTRIYVVYDQITFQCFIFLINKIRVIFSPHLCWAFNNTQHFGNFLEYLFFLWHYNFLAFFGSVCLFVCFYISGYCFSNSLADSFLLPTY